MSAGISRAPASATPLDLDPSAPDLLGMSADILANSSAAPFSVEVVEGMQAVPAAEWDRCAGARNPFLSHAFLAALEESGSVGARTGWLPRHAVLRDADGRLQGCAPLYLKGHSYGEYIFDHGWANAYERAGGRYYPKLLSAVPFTPVPGPRLLLAPDAPAGAHAALAQGLIEIARALGVSTLGVNFVEETDLAALLAAGFQERHGHQFHWHNAQYADFDGFLEALQSRKRKQIRKERRALEAAGITVERLTGDALRPEHWDHFHRFYVDTYDRKWGSPYLTRAFFDLLQQRLADRVLLVMARHEGRWIAGALNLIGTDTVYGRNWGCAADFAFLHFELCYYQAIEFAIERDLARVEAGTQGEHKLQRGYVPVRTASAHWFADPGLGEAVARFLEQERDAEARLRQMLADHLPYRQSDSD